MITWILVAFFKLHKLHKHPLFLLTKKKQKKPSLPRSCVGAWFVKGPPQFKDPLWTCFYVTSHISPFAVQFILIFHIALMFAGSWATFPFTASEGLLNWNFFLFIIIPMKHRGKNSASCLCVCDISSSCVYMCVCVCVSVSERGEKKKFNRRNERGTFERIKFTRVKRSQ